MPSPSRLLVRLPNWLGDLLLARPLLVALKRGLPGARITAVAPGPLLDLVAGEALIDEPHAWPRDAAGRRRVTSAVRAWRPDAALVLPPSFSSAWLAWRSGAPRRIGYAHECRAPLLTRAERRPPRGDRHLADEYLHLASTLCPETGPARAFAIPLGLAAAHDAAAATRRAALGLADGDVAILGPGAIYGPTKRWPAERFAGVGRRLVERGLQVLVCGTADEAQTCAAVADAVGRGARSIAGATSLPELAGICRAARVAVCNDSGLAHLCAALDVPTVAVFGSTSSAWTAPLGRAVRIVQEPPVCSPCFQPTCRIGIVCLAAVTEARVWSACEQLLAEVAA